MLGTWTKGTTVKDTDDHVQVTGEEAVLENAAVGDVDALTLICDD